jgi:hypothetical protein
MKRYVCFRLGRGRMKQRGLHISYLTWLGTVPNHTIYVDGRPPSQLHVISDGSVSTLQN